MFSTGSHAQYPPHPSTEYDHSEPRNSPAVRQTQANIVHRRVMRIHWSDRRPVSSAAIPNANGTVMPMNPRYSIGGCAAISGWFCSSGSGPCPSRGRLRQRSERVRRERHQQQVEAGDDVHHAERPRERLRPLPPEPDRDGQQVAGQDEVPQQQRALVGRPQREHLEERRRGAGGVLGDVAQREVVREDRDEHRDVRDQDQRAERPGRRPRALDHERVARTGTDERRDRAVDRDGEREEQGERPDDGGQRREQPTGGP